MADGQGQASAKTALRCFVVMGFGVKTDLATGRQLNLDKSYKNLIKPVVEAKGIACVRADEIRHTGTIDVPMYEQLLGAEVVIADISTANPNAIYELGIRHALRPRTTIVISENKLPYPFDLNHVLISNYTHSGDDIGFDEVMRFRQALGDTLDAVLAQPKTDSPIYTFLTGLQPPSLQMQAQLAAVGHAVAGAVRGAIRSMDAAAPPTADSPTLSVLVAQGEAALEASRFVVAKALFTAAADLTRPPTPDGASRPTDDYLQQRLVLATYKSRLPTEADALEEAMALLQPLKPAVSNDPETLGLAAAIEKRLHATGRGEAHLDQAIRYCQRGYYLRDDYYNGINLAFLLTQRADTPDPVSDQERIADLVGANRIRREVLDRCRAQLDALRTGTKADPQGTWLPALAALQTGSKDKRQAFWLLATMAEAQFGLGDQAGYQAALADANALEPEAWMLETTSAQIARLGALLARRGQLIAAAP